MRISDWSSDVCSSDLVPIDISGDFLRDAAAALAQDFPDLPVIPVEADFMEPIALPEALRDLPKLGFFPGSTIGNLVPRTSVDLLRAIRDLPGHDPFPLIGSARGQGEGTPHRQRGGSGMRVV